jgi:hypothetical protein
MGLPAKTKKEKYSKILDSKKNSTLEVLCKGQPAAFVKYLSYIRKLEFEEIPDYTFCRKLF